MPAERLSLFFRQLGIEKVLTPSRILLMTRRMSCSRFYIAKTPITSDTSLRRMAKIYLDRVDPSISMIVDSCS